MLYYLSVKSCFCSLWVKSKQLHDDYLDFNDFLILGELMDNCNLCMTPPSLRALRFTQSETDIRLNHNYTPEPLVLHVHDKQRGVTILRKVKGKGNALEAKTKKDLPWNEGVEDFFLIHCTRWREGSTYTKKKTCKKYICWFSHQQHSYFFKSHIKGLAKTCKLGIFKSILMSQYIC